jgi:hypothetical protein
MDIKIRQIISKAAGTYFIVTNNSQVAEIEAESKMRLYFINTEKGAVNSLFNFAKGDTAGFTNVFGKANRSMEKKGNFSHSTCLASLTAGPIAVINLRAFDSDVDKAYFSALNTNRKTPGTSASVSYASLFNTNAFWVPKKTNLEQIDAIENDVLQFANIGTNNPISFFVVKSTSKYEDLTSEGDKTLAETNLELVEYPLLTANQQMYVKDTFVDVYVFNQTFNTLSNTNPYYGHLFNSDGKIDLSKIDELIAIPEAGYATVFTGSIIPNLKSEDDADVSIDTVINQTYMQYGLLCNINEEIFESSIASKLDLFGVNIYNPIIGAEIVEVGNGKNILSHAGPTTLTTTKPQFPPIEPEDLIVTNANFINYVNYMSSHDIVNKTFIGAFEQGLRIGDKLVGYDGTLCYITAMEILSTETVIYDTYEEFTYQKVKYTYSGTLYLDDIVLSPIKFNSFVENGLILPLALSSYVLRAAQLTDGTSAKQTEILNMMNNPGIVKGIKTTKNLRYVVDCFKSFVEASYKYQFGTLMKTLDEGNKFMRAIINEPFVEDLQNSTNPLFKATPTGNFDWAYVTIGGNKTYSSKLLTKFSLGADMCFFYGPGNIINTVTKGLAGEVSNLFYTKRYAFDVIANESGYTDGITELEYKIDDDERAYCEKFRYNPIIEMDGLYTIFGNNSGTAVKSAQQQIQNSELLAYVKESLYNLSKKEAFKPGNYNDYLRTETESLNFMNALALAGAIQANPIVICNASNNTPEIQKQRIKLVHIEYTPTNSLEKVVFDLQIN